MENDTKTALEKVLPNWCHQCFLHQTFQNKHEKILKNLKSMVTKILELFYPSKSFYAKVIATSSGWNSFLLSLGVREQKTLTKAVLTVSRFDPLMLRFRSTIYLGIASLLDVAIVAERLECQRWLCFRADSVLVRSLLLLKFSFLSIWNQLCATILPHFCHAYSARTCTYLHVKSWSKKPGRACNVQQKSLKFWDVRSRAPTLHDRARTHLHA